MNDLLAEQADAAWKLYDAGLNPGPAVYGAKTPIAGYSLKEHIRQPLTEDGIRRFFCSGILRNIFIPCCPETGVVGLDFDSSTAAMEARRKLPLTEMVTVTARGLHLLYPVPEGLKLRSAVKAIILGIPADIRWGTAYLLAAPSRHPSGTLYRREGSWSRDRSTVFDPAWIAEKPCLRARPCVPCEPTEVMRRMRKYASRVLCVEHRAAHNTFFRLCCQLAARGLDEEQMRRIIDEWNSTNCFREDAKTPYPWSDAEIRHKIRDALKR